MVKSLLSFAGFIWIASCSATSETPRDISFVETRLDSLPKNVVIWAPKFSPDGRKVAYWAEDQNKDDFRKYFVIAGATKIIKENVGYDNSSLGGAVDYTPHFSPDGRVLVFGASRGQKYFMVVDGLEQEGFDDIRDLTFSENSQTVAYVGRRDGQRFIVVNGKTHPANGFSRSLVVTADGRVAYHDELENLHFVVVDGLPGPQCEGVDGPVLSPDGKHLAYGAKKSGKSYIVLDGQWMDAPYEVWNDPVFSPDGVTLAYPARDNDAKFVVVGDRRGKSYDSVSELSFSPDGKKVAYHAARGERLYAVVGEEEGPGFDEVGEILFSPMGNSMAYRAREGNRWLLVVNGKKGEAFDEVDVPAFSRDGKVIAYAACLKERRFVVVNGQRGQDYHWIENVVVNNDGVGIAYCAEQEKDGDSYVVVNGRRSEPFRLVWKPIFSADGKRVAFGAIKNHEIWWKVLQVE